ncbi:MAG: DUF4401 domain-containing protein [Proteobacteria bacterium]|nr:DUF4401 domain-containing protein [Pseudomonadota bacterium]
MKNENSITEVLSGLQADFSFDEEAIVAERSQARATSLPMHVLSLFGGLISASFFLLFLGVTGLFDSKFAMGFLGTIFLMATILFSALHSHKPHIHALCAPIYLAGLALLSFAIDASSTTTCFILIVISLITLAAVRSFLLSFLSVLTINGSIIFLLAEARSLEGQYIYIALQTLAICFLFFKEAKIITLGEKVCRLYVPVRVAMIVSLMAAFILTIIQQKEWSWVGLEWSAWSLLPSVVSIAVILCLVPGVHSVLKVERNSHRLMTYLFIPMLLVPTAIFPPLPVSLMLLLLSFRYAYKTGFVIGIVSFLYFTGQFYYDLNLTLLLKSILMMVSGVMFLVFFYLTRHKLAFK